MLKVRRSLTEILLEVTNDEISSVCKEVWRRYCSKGIENNVYLFTSKNKEVVKSFNLEQCYKHLQDMV